MLRREKTMHLNKGYTKDNDPTGFKADTEKMKEQQAAYKDQKNKQKINKTDYKHQEQLVEAVEVVVQIAEELFAQIYIEQENYLLKIG